MHFYEAIKIHNQCLNKCLKLESRWIHNSRKSNSHRLNWSKLQLKFRVASYKMSPVNQFMLIDLQTDDDENSFVTCGAEHPSL